VCFTMTFVKFQRYILSLFVFGYSLAESVGTKPEKVHVGFKLDEFTLLLYRTLQLLPKHEAKLLAAA